MVRPHEHSIPPSQPAPFRHLGVGGGGSGGERPVRVKLIAIIIGIFVLAAVPLYLWRRPKAAGTDLADAGASASASASAAPVNTTDSLIAAAMDGGVKTDEVTLSKVWVDSCQIPAAARAKGEQCDRQPFFEEALVKAVLENTSCAPKLPKGGTLSFAMRVDHRAKTVSVFAGKTGSIRRRAAQQMIKCVSRALPTPKWEGLTHQHDRYVVAVLATYPPQQMEPPQDKGSNP